VPDAGNKFALVLLDESAAVPAEVYGELARLLGRVRYDVIGAFKRNPGVPFEDLGAGDADSAARLLAGSGVRAAAVPAGRLPALPKVLTVHKADLPEGGGLSVQTDYVGTMREMPWGEIAGLSAATVSEHSAPLGPGGPSVGRQVAGAAVRMAVGLTIGIPGIPGRPKHAPKAAAPRVEVYGVLAVSAFSVPLEVRFREDTLSYEFLGGRMTAKAAQNFRVLAGELLHKAPRARASSAFRALAETGAAAPPMDHHEFARHNRWLKLLAVEGLE
jgi:hypothetical protein